MSISFIGFLCFCFAGMTLINRVIEASWITASDIAIVNQLTIVRNLEVGTWSIPVPNLNFVTGLMHLVKFDYSFFGGNAGLVQYFLYSLTGALSVGLFFVIVGLLYNYFGRR